MQWALLNLPIGLLMGGALVWFVLRNRNQELLDDLSAATAREAEWKVAAANTEQRRSELDGELRVKLQENGRLQSEATRVADVNAMLSLKEGQIQSLNDRILKLELEKTTALSEAKAAQERSSEVIAGERRAQAQIGTAKDEQITKLNDFIAQARGVLTNEFKALSADTLTHVSAQLLKAADDLIGRHAQSTKADVHLHQQEIGKLLQPVEDTLKRLDKQIGESDTARVRAEALLSEQVSRLADASESLTTALRKPVIRGSWGEMTLENALENAGLESEIDFVLQHTTDAEDGGRRRTDAIINLPKGRRLIIDSKNLMDSYFAVANAKDETQRAAFSEIHAKSLRGHIKSLSGKEYWRRYDGLDCVILFIPHDGMYHAAIADEADLIREACEKRVFITNPMSLIPLLKAIRYVLDQERLSRNADEIKKVGEELYGELTRFASNVAAIGDRLKSTVVAYNEAIPGLDRFIVAKARTLKRLGTSKGPEPELAETIELEPRHFSSRELKSVNQLFEFGVEEFDLAASANPGEGG